MSMKHWWNDTGRDTKGLEEQPFLHNNPTCTGLRVKPGPCSQRLTARASAFPPVLLPLHFRQCQNC